MTHCIEGEKIGLVNTISFTQKSQTSLENTRFSVLERYTDASGKPNADPNAPVMHSKIAKGDHALLMASDYPTGLDTSSQGNNFSVFIDCSSDGELEELFTALSQDGKVTTPPSDMPAGRFGMCDDAFGVSWILNCAKSYEQ